MNAGLGRQGMNSTFSLVAGNSQEKSETKIKRAEVTQKPEDRAGRHTTMRENMTKGTKGRGLQRHFIQKVMR